MVYRVDADDHLVYVDSEFRRVARAEGAPELAEPDALGRSLWEYVTGPDNRRLWNLLMSRVRASGRTIAVPYRCDTPTERREMRMELRPLDDAGIEYWSELVHSEKRQARSIFDPEAARSDQFVLMCSWCDRFAVDGWHEVEDVAEQLELFTGERPPRLTHGVCETCAERVLDAANG